MRDIEELPENYSEQLHKMVGENVKRIRREKNITQLQLSEALGYKSVSPISCGEIYYNKIHFNIDQLSKIAYLLDIDICEFFKPLHS